MINNFTYKHSFIHLNNLYIYLSTKALELTLTIYKHNILLSQSINKLTTHKYYLTSFKSHQQSFIFYLPPNQLPIHPSTTQIPNRLLIRTRINSLHL